MEAVVADISEADTTRTLTDLAFGAGLLNVRDPGYHHNTPLSNHKH